MTRKGYENGALRTKALSPDLPSFSGVRPESPSEGALCLLLCSPLSSLTGVFCSNYFTYLIPFQHLLLKERRLTQMVPRVVQDNWSDGHLNQGTVYHCVLKGIKYMSLGTESKSKSSPSYHHS